MTVVPYRPWQRAALTGLAVVVLIVLTALSWRAGFRKGVEILAETGGGDIARASEQLVGLQLALSVMERTRQLDQEASTQAQASIAELRRQVATLERDTALYRQVMALDAAQPGLSVQHWELHQTELPDHYRYRLVLAHTGTGGASLGGTLRLTVERPGDEDVDDVAAPLVEVTQPVNMRYLQAFEGDLQVPPGGLPEHVKLSFHDEVIPGLQLDHIIPWQPQRDD